ncbi:MAG TPA: MFS transporter [Acidimicrobiales bacterium]|nr:MFS transporter [Acidimicrobiales bacterium]
MSRLRVEGALPHATDGVVEEREVDGEPGVFECAEGPMRHYRRTGDTVEFTLAIPFFAWLFTWPVKRELRRQLREGTASMPWWAPADRIDQRSATVLGALCGIAILDGFLGTAITQTLTYVADGFGVEGDGPQGVTLAAVRLAILIALPIVALADRRGRRQLLLVCTVAGVAFAVVTALTPSLLTYTIAQTGGRGFTTALSILAVVIAAEEMPAGARAFAASVTSMASALGAGFCVMALPLADIGDDGWRLVYLLPVLGLPIVRVAAKHLPESKRFVAVHDEKPHARRDRLWLLAAAAFFIQVFAAPANQLQNEFLRDERDFSAAAITLFTITTGTPAGLAVLAGGHLAEVRGRRFVGAVGLVGSTFFIVLTYLTSGPAMWFLYFCGAMLAGLTVPALRVYGPELFPTGLRAGTGGLLAIAGVAGAAAGVLAGGFLSDELGALGRAMAVLGIGPILVAILVVTKFPETAHRELEELNPEDLSEAS